MNLQDYVQLKERQLTGCGYRNVELVSCENCAIGSGGVREFFLSESSDMKVQGCESTQHNHEMPPNNECNATLVVFSAVPKRKRKAAKLKYYFKWEENK